MGDTARTRTATVALVVTVAAVVHSSTDNAVLATVCYLGVLIGAGLGAWAGAERAPRGQRLVPRLIASGVTLTALGDTLWSLLDGGRTDTHLSIANPPWLLSYVFLCAALCVVLRKAQAASCSDVNFLVDAATIVVVCVLIFWSIAVDSIVADQNVPPLVRGVTAAYPVADAVLLALVIRVLMSPNARRAVGALFAAGASLWLMADVAYFCAPEATGALLVVMDSCWMLALVLMARAAWRVRLVQPDASGAAVRPGRRSQLAVAVVPLFVPLALEVLTDLRGDPHHTVQLFVGMTVLIALAFVRTAGLLRSQERHQHELEAARDAALDASRAKSMFLANISHEIRTPLTTVLATGEMLEDTPLDVVQLDLLGKMNRQGELLRNLVEEILDFSRIEAGELKLASTPFDLHSMLADAADVYITRALEQGIGFDWHVDPEVPRKVIGDSGRLFQVLTNLLNNAFKFTEQGHVALLVRRAHGGGTSEDEVAFFVTDTGIGIAESDQKTVFDSFTQVDGSTTRRYGGSGLGLAICKQLVELMGGSIHLESQVGVGSTFMVRLPVRHDSPGHHPVEPSITRHVTTSK